MIVWAVWICICQATFVQHILLVCPGSRMSKRPRFVLSRFFDGQEFVNVQGLELSKIYTCPGFVHVQVLCMSRVWTFQFCTCRGFVMFFTWQEFVLSGVCLMFELSRVCIVTVALLTERLSTLEYLYGSVIAFFDRRWMCENVFLRQYLLLYNFVNNWFLEDFENSKKKINWARFLKSIFSSCLFQANIKISSTFLLSLTLLNNVTSLWILMPICGGGWLVDKSVSLIVHWSAGVS